MIRAARFEKANSLLEVNRAMLNTGYSVFISITTKSTIPESPVATRMKGTVPGSFENPNMNADMENR